MKKIYVYTLMFMAVTTCFSQQNEVVNDFTHKSEPLLFHKSILPVHNLFIITIDGFRWQELFNGADSQLINNEKYTPACAMLKMLYWAPSSEERRKKLLPFFWNVIGIQGQVYGNRFYNNKVNVANAYAKSYPGYNEIFTGVTDPAIASNKKIDNPNINVLEYLNSRPGFEDRIAAFTSWNVFPFILNEQRSGILINSGYDTLNSLDLSEEETLLNKTSDEGILEKTSTRYDQLTFLVAKDYIQQHKPRVLYLGLGETDEFAHQKRYDLYLNHANHTDKMLEQLWHWVQTTPGYANNTTFLITTDHGRGKKKKWDAHGQFIKGSSQTWLALIGPGLPAIGEVKESMQLYQQQLARSIAYLLGEEFITGNK